MREELSSWSASGAKRLFDCACIVALMPLMIPVCVAVAVAVWLTSEGPAMFLQERVGRHGKAFTILKFRTMVHARSGVRRAVTTTGNQEFTPIGRFLRRWKLDELPQLLNVLAGDMSLVGPRPKMPEHDLARLCCRPGITGAATVAFAREEAGLSRVPAYHLDSFYHSVILPTKLRLDARYMGEATLLTDLRLIVKSVLRRWDTSVMDQLLLEWDGGQSKRCKETRTKHGGSTSLHAGIHAQVEVPEPSGEISVF